VVSSKYECSSTEKKKGLATRPYLEEMSFRFNRRKSSDLLLDTLRHMVTAPVLTFEKLTAEKPSA
jgi:hypothetical protein